MAVAMTRLDDANAAISYWRAALSRSSLRSTCFGFACTELSACATNTLSFASVLHTGYLRTCVRRQGGCGTLVRPCGPSRPSSAFVSTGAVVRLRSAAVLRC
jgi:hypothetical protein